MPTVKFIQPSFSLEEIRAIGRRHYGIDSGGDALPGIDFLPLTVDYEERLYPAGKMTRRFYQARGASYPGSRPGGTPDRPNRSRPRRGRR